MDARSPNPIDGYQPGLTKYREVLAHCLPGHVNAPPGHQPRTQFEQRLVVALAQLIDERASDWVGDRPEHVVHSITIGNPKVACQ